MNDERETNETEAVSDHPLVQLPEGGAPADTVAWAAMAEAFRAQAEMVQRIHETQRTLVEQLHRNDKSPDVLASTRSLNETFKGLSEIQRGLLDAVLRRDRGGPLALLSLIVALSILTFVIVDKSTGEPAVLASDHARALDRNRDLELAVTGYRAAEPVHREETRRLEQRSQDAEQRHQESIRRAETAESALRASEKETARLKAEAADRDAQLGEFVLLRQQAAEAGRIQLESVDLIRRLRAAEARAVRLEKERERLAGMLLDERIESRSPADKVLAAATERGLIPKPKPADDASMPLRGAAASTFTRRLNRLFQKAEGEDAYEAIVVRGVLGSVLQEVSVGRYRGPKLLNTLQAKTLEIFADPEKDHIELRFKDGSTSTTSRPRSPISFSGGRHSVFLRGVGLSAWLARFRHQVAIGADGMLTWKSTPS